MDSLVIFMMDLSPTKMKIIISPPPLTGEGQGGGRLDGLPPTFTLLDKALNLTLVVNNISYLTG